MKIIIIMIVTLICVVLLLGIEVLTALIGKNPPFTNPSQEPHFYGNYGTELKYLVLGDSTAAGQGAVYEQGIAVKTAQHLALNYKVEMRNYGISGAKVQDVLEKEIPYIKQTKPDLVLLSVGANDVTNRTSLNTINQQLQQVIQSIKNENSNAKIVVTGSPDMGSVPRFKPPLSWIATWQSKRVNTVFQDIVQKNNLTFAPIAQETGPIFKKDRSLFSEDNFHPNEKGYEVWVDVLNKAIDKTIASN